MQKSQTYHPYVYGLRTQVPTPPETRPPPQLQSSVQISVTRRLRPPAMATYWRKEKPHSQFSLQSFILVAPISIFLLILLSLFFYSNPTPPSLNPVPPPFPTFPTPIMPLDCSATPQAHPIFANMVEGLRFPFVYSLSDMGSLPDKPHKNIVRMLKGKMFRRPDISVTVQEVLEGKKVGDGIVVDVGANVGMATFAASAMGFGVVAFEPVFENLQRICEAVFFNRVGGRVAVFAAAASDRRGDITFHKLEGRLDNSAVSSVSAKLVFKSNKEIEMKVASLPLDDVIPESQPVLLLKIDVQGWEYHVLRGATKLLSRKGAKAPYLIYEEDEKLLQGSNSTIQQIRQFLATVGYHTCRQHGTDAHCTKQ